MSEMQISVENVGRLNRRLKVIVPINELELSKKKRLAELAKTVRLDGFRPGKVPVAVIEKRYGDSIWGDVVQASLQSSLTDALQKNALNPASQPHIDLIKAVPGNDLEYTASFEIYPLVLAPELKEVSIEKLNVAITEADIDSVLEKMRYQHPDWVDVQRKSQLGDKVTFDLVFAGEEPRKGLEWVLEDGKIPEGFINLLGSAAGETLVVSIHKDNGSQQTVSASVQIQKVAEPKLAEINEIFAQRLGIQEGGIDALRTQIRQHMQHELDRVLREKLKTQVIDKLLKISSIEELPQVLLDQEYQRLEADNQRQRKDTKASYLVEEEKEDLQQTAKRRVTLGLIFNALVEKYHLHVDEVRVRQEAERIASAFQFEQSMKDKLYKNKNMMLNIRSSVLEDQVIDKLLEEAEYTEKTMEYKEIMGLTTTTTHDAISTEETA